MSSSRLRTLVTAPLAAAGAMAVTAALTLPATASPGDSGGTTTKAAKSGDDCYIHLFDGDDFDKTDDNFKLTKSGDYESLKDLPGADENWNDEADSAKVGSAATVKIWKKKGFKGKSKTLKPGSKHPSLSPEPSSLKMTCDDDGDGGGDQSDSTSTDLSQNNAITAFGSHRETTFTATVKSKDNLVSDGNVDFTATKNTLRGGGNTVKLCSNVSVKKGGTATCKASLRGLLGQYNVKAEYSDGDQYDDSTSNSVAHYVVLST